HQKTRKLKTPLLGGQHRAQKTLCQAQKTLKPLQANRHQLARETVLRVPAQIQHRSAQTSTALAPS
ncbi:MAG: hypothetical protein WBD47_09420, partial [Phormidesmis sp.]